MGRLSEYFSPLQKVIVLGFIVVFGNISSFFLCYYLIGIDLSLVYVVPIMFSLVLIAVTIYTFKFGLLKRDFRFCRLAIIIFGVNFIIWVKIMHLYWIHIAQYNI